MDEDESAHTHDGSHDDHSHGVGHATVEHGSGCGDRGIHLNAHYS